MNIKDALKSLDDSWSRDKVLLKIKNGIDPEYIVNEFINENKKSIEKLTNLLKKEDKDLLLQVEKLSNVEAKLLNKINNSSKIKKEITNLEIKGERIQEGRIASLSKLGSFMMKWSNKFVFITLLTISAIALSKQAWS